MSPRPAPQTVNYLSRRRICRRCLRTRLKKDTHKLQLACNNALRTAMGAIRTSPIPSLLVGAGEWPFNRRIEHLADRLLIRWRSRPQYPTLTTLRQLCVAPALTARRPLLLRRLQLLPPPPPQPPPNFHTWPCYKLPYADWSFPLPIFTVFPPRAGHKLRPILALPQARIRSAEEWFLGRRPHLGNRRLKNHFPATTVGRRGRL